MSDQELEILRLSNNQVQVTVFHAVWDQHNRQLVAAGIASTEKQSIQSILASLSTNSNTYLTLRTPYGYSDAYLMGAKKGFMKMSKTLSGVNAIGYVECVEHPAAGDPRQSDFEYFYVLATQGEDLKQKFVSRLKTAIRWPVLDEWADYLYRTSKEATLVRDLPNVGPTYSGALVAMKSDSAWEEIISAGVVGGRLSLN